MFTPAELQAAVDEHGSIDRAAKALGRPRDGFRKDCRAAGVFVCPVPPQRLRWGYGQAELVPSLPGTTELVAFVPDIHIPYQDHGLVDSCLNLISSLDPDRVVLLGDVLDFHAISRWNAGMDRLDNLQDEIDEAKGLLARIRERAQRADIHWTEGNHDERLDKYIATEARALKSLRSLSMSEQLGLKDLEITYHHGQGFRLRPEFLVKHGTMIRKGAGASAKAECMSAGISGISGHTHRLAPWRQDGYRSLQWNEAGTLSRLDPPYHPGAPDWRQGMCIGFFGKASWRVEEVYVEGGRLVYGGRTF
ncbi:MAG TPA: metallophosphoesterase [Candidatus Paceibacterota bacterium]